MKKGFRFRSYLITLGLVLIPQTAALADESMYWPEFATTAEHNRWAIKEIKSDKANQSGITGAGVKVAILDSGVALNTPGLSSKIIAYKNFVSSQPPLQEHGTMTASSVAADLDLATGISGSAPGVSLIIGRVCYLNTCDSEAIRAAFNWAVSQGAQVISMSFGGGWDSYMNAAILAATQKGVVVVAALGNNGCSTYGGWGVNRSCLQGKTFESYPGGYSIPGLISAGASEHFGARASFSSWGPNLDLMAPGVDVAAFDPIGATNGFGGTSSATPLIAGVAALVLSIKPDLTASEVQAILQATARPAKETKPKVWDSCTKSTVDGTWSCNAEVESDLPQQYFTGAGIVDAVAAVALTQAIKSRGTIDAPTATSSLENISVRWTGGPADLYVNSKLVVKNATYYEMQGKYSQSFAFQIRRDFQVSKPILFQLNPGDTPSAPVVTEFNARANEIMLRTADLSEDASQLLPQYQTIAGGIFEFDDGRLLACTGYSPSPDADPSRPFWFNCPSATDLTNISGTFRLVNKYSKAGARSDQLTTTASAALKRIAVTTTYLSSDRIRFNWETIAGAKSYEYRYKPDGTMECSTGNSVEVTGDAPQPSGFYVRALPEPACAGNQLADSEMMSYRLLVPTPPKPTGITVKELAYIYTEFDVPNVDPKMYWRIYRSDGLMTRINPGQRFFVGLQPNEDVNGLTFSYRFIQVNMGMWGEVWSEPSDPITVTSLVLTAPSGHCQYGIRRDSVNCFVNSNTQVEATILEYLDSDLQVLGSSTSHTAPSLIRTTANSINGAVYVRVAATTGRVGEWYRRGESSLIKIQSRGFASSTCVAR